MSYNANTHLRLMVIADWLRSNGDRGGWADIRSAIAEIDRLWARIEELEATLAESLTVGETDG